LLRNAVGPKRQEVERQQQVPAEASVIGGPNKSGRMTRVRYVSKTVEHTKACRVLVENSYLKKRPTTGPRRRRQKRMGGCGLNSSVSGSGQVAKSCEDSNDPSGATRFGEHLHQLGEEYFAPCG
jgi:hypothetical protein